jgi:hypothetical protein
MERAEAITDPNRRASYLERVADNARVLALASKFCDAR